MQGRYQTYQRAYYRSVFLSNCYIGSSSCQADSLLDTLKSFDCDHLFLIGNTFDGDTLRRCWTWGDTHTRIVNELIKKSANGTRITYIAGHADHDIAHIFSRAEKWHARINKFRFQRKTIHTLSDGRQILLRYGHMFHQKPRHFRVLNQAAQKCQKAALKFLNQFEHKAVKHAVSYDVDGIICGYNSAPRKRFHDGTLYASPGSWTNSAPSFMAEDASGHLKTIMLDPPSTQYKTPLFPSMALPDYDNQIQFHEDARQYNAISAHLINRLETAWRRQGMTLAPHFYQTHPKTHIWTHLKHIA